MEQLPNELYWKILLYDEQLGSNSRIDKRSFEIISNPDFWHQWLGAHKPKLLALSRQLTTRTEFINLVRASEGDEDAKETTCLTEYMDMRQTQLVLKVMMGWFLRDAANQSSENTLHPKLILYQKRLEALGMPYDNESVYMLALDIVAQRFILLEYVDVANPASIDNPHSHIINKDFSATMYALADKDNPIKFWIDYFMCYKVFSCL